MNIVLDSNILLMSIGRKSKYNPIWKAFLNETYNLIVSDEIVYEYEEILQRHLNLQIAAIAMDTFVEALNVINQKVYYSWNLINSDPDDNKFFDVAVAANADFLVTNDAHFNIVKKIAFPSVAILSANEFLNIVNQL